MNNKEKINIHKMDSKDGCICNIPPKENTSWEERKCTRCSETKLLSEFEIVKVGDSWRRKVCRTCRLVKDKVFHQKNKAKRLLQLKERGKNPIERKKRLARQTLRNTISKGLIKRLPCEKCGIEPSDAHHTDYNKPLEVLWLCKKHHYEKHRK